MPIAAQLEEPVRVGDRPRDSRRKLWLQAQGKLPKGNSADVLVHNISATGMLLECQTSLETGDRIEVALPHAGETWAQVVWTSGSLFGCQFDAPISPAAQSASLLRAVPGEHLDIAAPTDVGPTESFGALLQRLRKGRGMSLAQIAARVGVSKPTVWAWEQGKARPVESRIDALAEALDISPSQLLPTRDTPALRDLLTRSREQIASALGTAPDKVRILIEL